jgi:hypothetical protein
MDNSSLGVALEPNNNNRSFFMFEVGAGGGYISG